MVLYSSVSVFNEEWAVAMVRFSKKTPSNEDEEDEAFFTLNQKIRALQNNRKILLRQKYDLEKNLAEFQKELRKLTRSPWVVGTIEEVLEDEQMAIVRSSTGPSYLTNYSSVIDPKDLVPGAQVGLNQRNFSIIRVMADSQDPYITQMEVEDKPKVDFEDIGGLVEQIRSLRETVELPLTDPQLFQKVGIDPPRGLLLYGPPGSGKTLLAKAVARSTKAVFINVVGSALVQKYIGEGARLVRELFEYAERRAPAIIFIDELDAIGSRREMTNSGDFEVQRTLMELLAQMDGFAPHSQVKVIGATNRPDILDPALVRAGRFDRHVEVPLPDQTGRREIFKLYLGKMNVRYSAGDLDTFTELTEDISGAMVKAICTEAGMNAIRRGEDIVIASDIFDAIQAHRLDSLRTNLTPTFMFS